MIDDSKTREIVDRMKDLPFDKSQAFERKRIKTRVKNAMLWSDDKSEMWMVTPNPQFGNISPDTMIKIGRGHKVNKFIDSRD